MPAMYVFSSAIRFLKDHLMKSLAEMMHDVRDGDVKWVLTVPAIWDDAAKQFMREAADQVIFFDNFEISCIFVSKLQLL